MNKGKFIISLDFELHWGFFDNRDLDDSKAQLARVNSVIDRLIQMTEEYEVSITFATVGFLFANNKSEVQKYLPNEKPNYINKALNAYHLLDGISDNDQSFYFAQDLVNKLKREKRHEVGTHTFSHYYCYEKGQNITAFKADIKAAVEIAKALDIETKSIVFPRNQVETSYIKVCEALGLSSYRGNAWFNFNNDVKQRKLKGYAMKASRFLDSYLNISGSNSYTLKDYNDANANVINIPASRFLRPYSPILKSLEKHKVSRIKGAMTKAAKNNEVYHLWWHPHNFANHSIENFRNLESIFKHYKILNETYGFKSITMRALAEEYKMEHAF